MKNASHPEPFFLIVATYINLSSSERNERAHERRVLYSYIGVEKY